MTSCCLVNIELERGSVSGPVLSCFLFYSTSLSFIFVFVCVCVLPDVTGYYAPSSSHSTSGAVKSSDAKPDKQMTQGKLLYTIR